ncbi:MAG: PAS domain-containing protein, partial [Mycobacteriales bacterium]
MNRRTKGPDKTDAHWADAPKAGDAMSVQGAPRVVAARRLAPPVGGNPALDRLAGLAARLLSSTSAQVSLLADAQLIAGGAGLAEGAIGTTSPAAESLCYVTASRGTPLLVSDAPIDDRVCALPPVTSGAVGSYLGVPLTADDGHIVGALCVFDTAPREWSDTDVATLTQLAASAVAELELSALSAEYQSDQLLWSLALDAARVGTFEWDIVSGVFTWDQRLRDLFGYDELPFDHTFEAFESRVHPDDRARIANALEDCIATRGEYVAEYRIAHPDGSPRWISARGRALCDSNGVTVKVLGAAHDATAARDADARVARVLESMSAGFLSMDREWRITYINAEGERITGRGRSELIGQTLWHAFPATVGSDFESNYRTAMSQDKPVTFEAYYPAPLNAWYEVRAWSNPDGITLYFLDVSARRAAQAEAAAATLRTALLSDVAGEFALTMDAAGAAGRLARLVVPDIADWCVVSLVDSNEHVDPARSLRDVGWWHVDPAARPLTQQFAGARADALTEESMVYRAVRTAQPVVVP